MSNRRLTFEVFRYNPQDPESTPHMETFEITEQPYMSLFMALNEIRESQDPSLPASIALHGSPWTRGIRAATTTGLNWCRPRTGCSAVSV